MTPQPPKTSQAREALDEEDRRVIRLRLPGDMAERVIRAANLPESTVPAAGLRELALKAQAATTREEYEGHAAELVRLAATPPASPERETPAK